ncbi:pathogenesis-related protein 1 [Favolaschia claudopus]|uniref:Pathogenesis-related protein 1 n=1 Tax=Favolaschia claudopus TaxID=2862362 RepID=A0AAW0ECT1_9AGAR
MASTAATKAKGKPQPLTDQEISQNHQRMQNELQGLAGKIGELDQESDEHSLVLTTLNEALADDPDRKCFRLIGGVLVERTVKDVVPTLRSNRDNISKLVANLTEQIDKFLDAHNIVRAAHGAADLVWNETLADAAQTWAKTCQVKHSDGTLLDTPYGENIVAATGLFGIATAMGQFILDKSEYDPENPTYNHFTQVVWKSTTQLGCSVARCGDIWSANLGTASYYVCLYEPAGNVVGEAL